MQGQTTHLSEKGPKLGQTKAGLHALACTPSHRLSTVDELLHGLMQPLPRTTPSGSSVHARRASPRPRLIAREGDSAEVGHVLAHAQVRANASPKDCGHASAHAPV